MPDTPDVRVVLRWVPGAGPDVPPEVALRMALRVLRRRFGWRVVEMEVVLPTREEGDE